MADPAAALREWPDVDRWRRSERERLLAARAGTGGAARARQRATITRALAERLDPPAGRVISFYWPYRAEVDLRELMHDMLARGARVALPAVVERGRSLEFRRWSPDGPLERNALGIPAPAMRSIVRPEVILAPLLGFDDDNFRLGLGGGYFDRTLATLDPKPWTIGVGIEIGRLPTIHPQPHDVPLDLIVTEARVQARAGDPPTVGSERATSPGLRLSAEDPTDAPRA